MNKLKWKRFTDELPVGNFYVMKVERNRPLIIAMASEAFLSLDTYKYGGWITEDDFDKFIQENSEVENDK